MSDESIPAIKSDKVGMMLTRQPWFLSVVSNDGTYYSVPGAFRTRREAEDSIRAWNSLGSVRFALIVEVELPCAVAGRSTEGVCPDCGGDLVDLCGGGGPPKCNRCGYQKEEIT